MIRFILGGLLVLSCCGFGYLEKPDSKINNNIPYKNFTNKFDSSYGSFNTQSYKIENGVTLDGFGYLIRGSQNYSDGIRQNDKYDDLEFSGIIKYDTNKDMKFLFTSGLSIGSFGLPGAQPAEDIGLRTATQNKFGTADISNQMDREKNTKAYMDISSEVKFTKTAELLTRVYFDYSNESPHKEHFFSNKRYKEDDVYTGNIVGTDFKYSEYGIIYDDVLSFGIDLSGEQLNITTNDLNVDADTTATNSSDRLASMQAIYVKDEMKLMDNWTTLFGIRLNSHSAFKESLTPHISTIYKIGDINLKASVCSIRKEPTLYEIYLPSRASIQGNTDLIPQTTLDYKIGVESNLGKTIYSSISFFRRDVKDMIMWLPVATTGIYGPKWKPVNINNVVNQGIELETKIQIITDTTISAGYTYTHTKQINDELIDAKTNEFKDIERTGYNVPQHQLNCSFDYTSGFGLDLDINGRYVDKRYCYYINYSKSPYITMDTKELPSYSVFGIKISQKISGRVKLFVSMDNVFDVKYKEMFGDSIDDRDYPAKGRAFAGGISLLF